MIKKRRNLLTQSVPTEIPLDQGGKVKVGDYVAVDAIKIKQLLNHKQITPFIHKVKNRLYIIKLGNGMATVTSGKWSRTPNIEIPISVLRSKIINYEQ